MRPLSHSQHCQTLCESLSCLNTAARQISSISLKFKPWEALQANESRLGFHTQDRLFKLHDEIASDCNLRDFFCD